MDRMRKAWAMALAGMLMTAAAWGVPVIQHDPIQVAEKGAGLGVRASVRDAAARVESVSLFYAASRGMTPFRVAMTSSGAGVWYATIPGHMIGPGSQLFYYIQAENADGETRETDWQTVKVVESGIAPEEIPAASDVARQAQRDAVPPKAAAPAPAPAAAPKAGKAKYLVPAAVIVGGAVAVGGAFAIANYDSGGGGGDSDEVPDGNFGGNYNVCFDPTSISNETAATVCDTGLVNVYVRGGSVEIVGLWGAEVLTTSLNGQTFSVNKNVPETAKFPECTLIVTGEINGNLCAATVNGYSREDENPGNLSGMINTTRR